MASREPIPALIIPEKNGIAGRKMQQQLLEYLKSERQDFLDFIAHLYPLDFKQTFNRTEQYKDTWFPRQFFPTGIITGPVFEADFNGFSFNMLKSLSKDERVLELCRILDSLKQAPAGLSEEAEKHYEFRQKKLRIALYLNL